MRALLVEDDPKLAGYVAQALREEGWAVDVAATGPEGSLLAHTEPYDAVVLDVMLPGKNGFQIVAELRAAGVRTPVLILTARDDTASLVQSLDLGADDYVTKPFTLEEVLARLRALTRRGAPTGRVEALRYADVEVDRLRHVARRGGQVLPLTAREFQILELLVSRPEQVVRRTEFLEKVWDLQVDPDSNVVDVHVGNLRRKLAEAGGPPLVQTVRGVGFVLRLANTAT
ncbi:response regulator transcription factor [Roseisolibacter agri]|uniref:DNA-binding response regulator n=1 Tax=Roseisolibacter agri TaxID=2014610 RepID=A0AA37Q8G8_9BACT|nr:response regulator transcription factor [Roseisolibacter agri]GLC28209.1 DNA-binding response regulator [Roseisolibacter agri]